MFQSIEGAHRRTLKGMTTPLPILRLRSIGKSTQLSKYDQLQCGESDKVKCWFVETC